MMISKALEIWDRKLKIPLKAGEFSIERIDDTNLLLTKDHDGRVGFIVENTLPVRSIPSLKNFEIDFFTELFNKKKRENHRNCLLVLASRGVNPEFLIRILVGLMEKSFPKKITSKQLIGTIIKVSETFDLLAGAIQDIVGAWGELYFISHLVRNANDKAAQLRIIKSWESVLGRKQIDFRFKESKKAVEIKTTRDENRVHHINGLGQLAVPAGFAEAYLVSLRIMEDDIQGKTCHELYHEVKSMLKTRELQLEFEERVLVRGSVLCKNRDKRFSPRDQDLLTSFFAFKKIPRPKLQPEILEVSWAVDFDRIKHEGRSSASAILSAIPRTRD